MSKKSSQVTEDYDDDLALYTSEAKESAYDTPRGMGLDLSRVECLEDDNLNIQETPITVGIPFPKIKTIIYHILGCL